MESGDKKLCWNSRLVVAFFWRKKMKENGGQILQNCQGSRKIPWSESIPIDIWLLTQADNVSGSEDDYFVLIEWCLTFDITHGTVTYKIHSQETQNWVTEQAQIKKNLHKRK